MQNKLSSLSSQRLEFEISSIYWAKYQEETYQHNRTGKPAYRGVAETGTLALLWEEFDARAAAGTLGDDTEGVLNDVTKY